MPIEERTHRFKREHPVDCRGWLSFTIVESTIHYHRIRYTYDREVVDKFEREDVDFGEHAGNRPADNS